MTTDASQIVCGHCAKVNRIDRQKPARAARCGACHEALFDGHPVSVDEAAFEKHVERSDIAVLVDVWAPWCGPCRQMAPQFARAAQMLEPGIRLLKLNADEAPRVSARYGIRGIPALLLFKDGRLIAQTAGAMDANRIVNWTRSHFASSGGAATSQTQWRTS